MQNSFDVWKNQRDAFQGGSAHVQARACTGYTGFVREQNGYVACIILSDGCQSRQLHCLNGFVRVLSGHVDEYNASYMHGFTLTGVCLILTGVKMVYYIACYVLTGVKAVNYIVDGALSMRKMGGWGHAQRVNIQ